VDNLEPKFPIAIAVNEKYNQLLLSHPSIQKSPSTNSIFAVIPIGFKIIVLQKMDDGCLPLYSEADIKLAFEADESFRREIGITFVDWLNLCGRSMINYPPNPPDTSRSIDD
jgi:hypothetical protein